LKSRHAAVAIVNDLAPPAGSNGTTRHRRSTIGAAAHRSQDDEELAVQAVQQLPTNAGLAAQFRTLADLSAHLCDGAACLIAWQGAEGAATIRAATDSLSESLLNSLLAAVERDPRFHSHPNTALLRFNHNELAAACGPQPRAMTCAAVTVSHAAIGGAVAMRATAILTAPRTPHSLNLATAAEMTANATLAVLRASAADESRDFWRKRTGESAQQLTRSRAESSSASLERHRIDRATAAAEKLHSRNRFASLGSLIAKLGPFDAWIIAIAEDETLRVSAASGVLATSAVIDAPSSRASALNQCFLRQATIARATRRSTPEVYDEDRTFARFDSYICVPLENGVVALAGRTAPDATTVARIEVLAARLNPLIAKWLLEAETDRLRRLVRNLGLRMFGAIDSERARIARDLHDHQAQLLAAARIGIEAGPDEARGIFKQLEDALRLRVRELKPPTLGRSTLAEGLRYELRRLADAGIKGRLTHVDKMNALTRPVQQVCYQVAREALANVLRHAGASRVEIAIEKRGERVRLSILDNGKGMGNATGHGGLGLGGLTERLELMGGRLRVESKAGSTRLVAEIPEPA
jgi:signal transduction histidine kinase